MLQEVLMRRIALYGLLALLASPLAAWAHEGNTALDKLGRGLAGMTTGFLELPGNVVAVARDEGAVGGVTIGLAKGVGMVPVRTLVGVYEFVTSPIPAPEHYKPILEPTYPWGYFDGAPSARMSAAMRGETRRAAHRTRSGEATSGARK
jgi:putative exosortase-associated protein (TIGR04073 family)